MFSAVEITFFIILIHIITRTADTNLEGFRVRRITSMKSLRRYYRYLYIQSTAHAYTIITFKFMDIIICLQLTVYWKQHLVTVFLLLMLIRFFPFQNCIRVFSVFYFSCSLKRAKICNHSFIMHPKHHLRQAHLPFYTSKSQSLISIRSSTKLLSPAYIICVRRSAVV